MNIQIFGTKKCKDTKKAERFFKERNIPLHFRDINQKNISPGELASIASAVGIDNLIDEESKSYKKRGMQYMDFDAAEEILDDSGLLKTPIVRNGKEATVGVQENEWKKWLSNNT